MAIQACTEEATANRSYNHLGTHGRWAFAEFTEVYQMQADFATKVDAAFNKMLENALHTSIVPV